MLKPSPQMRILLRALQHCGGETALARSLNVSTEALARWLGGRDALPVDVYFRARRLVPATR